MRAPIAFHPVLALVTASAVALLTLPAPGDAQSSTLSWTETSTLEVPGTLGMVLRAMPGALDSRSSHQTLHLQGGTLIQQDGSSATLMDADHRRFVSVDHDAQTYMVFTFEESAQAAREMSGLMSEAMAGADEAMDEVRQERDAAMAELRQVMDEEEEERVVRPLFRLTTTKEDIVHGDTGEDVLGALERRMEGYRQVTMAELMEQAETR